MTLKSTRNQYLSPRERKRLATLRRRKSMKDIREDARRAGRLTPTKFNTERSQAANKKRWAEHNRKKLEKQLKKEGSENSDE